MFYLDRTDSYYKQCTFENGLCSWVILSEINQTCQFEIVSGLDAALSKRKALNDHTNNSFAGKCVIIRYYIKYANNKWTDYLLSKSTLHSRWKVSCTVGSLGLLFSYFVFCVVLYDLLVFARLLLQNVAVSLNYPFLIA